MAIPPTQRQEPSRATPTLAGWWPVSRESLAFSGVSRRVTNCREVTMHCGWFPLMLAGVSGQTRWVGDWAHRDRSARADRASRRVPADKIVAGAHARMTVRTSEEG